MLNAGFAQGLLVGLGLTLAAAALTLGPAGCEEEEALDVSTATCPNELPVVGDACTEPDLVCKYVIHECYDLRHYACTGGVWTIEQECTPAGGGGAGGEGGGSGGSTGGGGAGGEGGVATGGSGGEGGSAAGGSAGSGGTG